MANTNLSSQHTNDYSLLNNMQCPKLLGTPSKVTFEKSVDTIANNFSNYVIAYPFSGVNTDFKKGATESSGFYTGPDLSLGSNYFRSLGRTCDSATSDKQCRGKPAFVYIRNIPSGSIPLLGDVSFSKLTGCNIDSLTEGRGLLPGLLEDISDISPLALAEALQEQGNVTGTKCEARAYPVGTHIYDAKKQCLSGDSDCDKGKKTWQMETQCTPSVHYVKSTTDLASSFTVPGARGLFQTTSPEDNETFENIKDAPIPFPLIAVAHFLCIACFLLAVAYFFYFLV